MVAWVGMPCFAASGETAASFAVAWLHGVSDGLWPRHINTHFVQVVVQNGVPLVTSYCVEPDTDRSDQIFLYYICHVHHLTELPY
jgi:hypothetical protein